MAKKTTVQEVQDLLLSKGYTYIDRFSASLSEDYLTYLGKDGDKIKIVVSKSAKTV